MAIANPGLRPALSLKIKSARLQNAALATFTAIAGQKLSKNDLGVLARETRALLQRQYCWKDDLLRQLQHTVQPEQEIE